MSTLIEVAVKCGATVYRHRLTPQSPALAFGDESWAKFCHAISSAVADTLASEPDDTQRLDWLLGAGRHMSIESALGSFRIVDPTVDLVVTDWNPTMRDAIDAAILKAREA